MWFSATSISFLPFLSPLSFSFLYFFLNFSYFLSYYFLNLRYSHSSLLFRAIGIENQLRLIACVICASILSITQKTKYISTLFSPTCDTGLMISCPLGVCSTVQRLIVYTIYIKKKII